MAGVTGTWTVPLGGNAFVTPWPNGHSHTAVVTGDGLKNWISEKTTCSIFFYVTNPGKVNLSLRLKVPGHGKSVMKVTLKDSGFTTSLDIKGSSDQIVPIGPLNIDKKGYANLELQGVSKTGDYFAEVSSLLISCKDEIRCVADDFYFGRRGPSVHFNYNLPADKRIKYFYNEVTVPEGQDAIGAYFCSTAFHAGYFGMQVNSEKERRVLFSIWSSFHSDDPAEIPEDFRVRLVRKGENVHVGQFGSEGSGGQSYLKYNWKAGSTYKFLVYGEPLQSNSINKDELNSQFSAWFWTPEENKWVFIATFIRPKERVYLKNIYSFSENFLPETGYIERRALFCNQWINDTEERWHEVTTAQFTGDDTSKKNRLDFAGGIEQGGFFLKNCGFFDDKVATGQFFTRPAKGVAPIIDFGNLP